MADKFMCIPNDDTQITPSVDYNLWLKSLNTQHNESIIKNQKVPKVSKPTNKETLI